MRAAGLTVFAMLLLATACSERARRNPLDPLAGDGSVAGVVGELSAVAGDQCVSLRWDYRHFRDVAGFRLYRRSAGDAYVCLTEPPLGRDATGYEDREVVNGRGYEYRLGLLVEGEGERLLEPTAAATPGPEIVWCADRGTGLVWRVAPDGRNAAYAQGRFAGASGMDVDPIDGTCWIADGYASGMLYQIKLDGTLVRWPAPLVAPGSLRVDQQTRRVWVADQGTNEVWWFDPPDAGAGLRWAVADAHFTAPSALAPQANGCWVGDPQAGRVLYVHPNGARVEYVDLPGIEAMAVGQNRSAWVLLDRGYRMVCLGAVGRSQFADLKFRGSGLAASGWPERVWVAGEERVALVTELGVVVESWEGPPGAHALLADQLNGTIWVAGTRQLWKLSAAGEQMGTLRGFSDILRVAVLPARASAAQR